MGAETKHSSLHRPERLSQDKPRKDDLPQPKPGQKSDSKPDDKPAREIGGYDGPEPTRFGDWQHKGRVTDF
jgi:hypothetical protein